MLAGALLGTCMVLNIFKGSDRHQFIVRLFMCFLWHGSAVEAQFYAYTFLQ